MPQLFQVLKCFKCFVFQVHQTKKSIKWECKLCGEKQSIKRHYGLGTGKECRIHVQKLNGVRGEIDELVLNGPESDEDHRSRIINFPINTDNTQKKESRWSDYVTNELAVEDDNEPLYMKDVQVVLEKPTKYRKLGTRHTKKSILKSFNSRYSDENILNSSNICNSDLISNSQNIKSFDQPVKQESKQFVVPVNSSKWALNEKKLQSRNEMGMQRISNENNSLSGPEGLKEIEHTVNAYCSIANNNLLSQYPLINSKSIDEIDKKIESTSVKYQPPKINNSSKWAQFIDSSDNPKDAINIEPASCIKNNHPQIPKVEALFSLCDDSDLDSVLNF